jgi:hypothetical protein
MALAHFKSSRKISPPANNQERQEGQSLPRPNQLPYLRLVMLRKMKGNETETGEEAILRMLAAGHGMIGHEIAQCKRFAVGHHHFPTIAGGVFRAWYVTRLIKNEAALAAETNGCRHAANERD